MSEGQPLRLLHSDSVEAEGVRFAAVMHVASDGGPIRTIVGGGHKHFVGEEPSQKTGLSNPYEGPTEYALIVDSELRSKVLDFRTQAFRLRLLAGGVVREWICDHLRFLRVDGVDIVEAIECKPDMSFLDNEERIVQRAASAVIEGMGWRHRIVYLRDVLGGGERQVNFGEIYARTTRLVPDDALARFERMCATTPNTTFRDLRLALDDDRLQGTAHAHAMICAGRVEVDLDRYLFDPMPVRLLPPSDFHSPIRF
ncbi:hypothetical protein HCH44_06125 [Sphingomonas melonis]|uniref:hypothetical protein n=1 Tax=Sphingomonas melonis TaxID=152682 RepID=UPI001C8BD904|nr:hypothetical protein [Sphingomonas melonis]MBX8844485.1 hypothetical protein [Sphingomonas melonis]MBX8852414.1 hypothetical protein [Sphingomonas melonis]MBX8897827.1 hypothetical protein [Sphingomonas melonis]